MCTALRTATTSGQVQRRRFDLRMGGRGLFERAGVISSMIGKHLVLHVKESPQLAYQIAKSLRKQSRVLLPHPRSELLYDDTSLGINEDMEAVAILAAG